MQFERLKQLAEQSLAHPHYEYTDRQAYKQNAAKSFERIPDPQKLKVRESWKNYLVAYCNKPKDEALSQSELSDLLWYRFLAQTNLFFLCNLLEKYSQVTVRTHEEICNEFFVKKDPTFTTFEAFANQYTPLKDRLLLVPRGGFKSSIDIADCVQWIICFPAVTILILTGVYLLAGDFVGELRQHFTLEETGEVDEKKKAKLGPKKLQDKETGVWSPSLFQVLFSEHCSADEGKSTEFKTPAGGDDKEPTVRAASIEQSLSGMHVGVLKLDDVVTNENSLTVTRMEAVNKQISVNRAMLHPYGFMDVIGTWYDECLTGNTLITMSDWSQKPISNIKVGDEVVGFTNEYGKRSMLVRSKVTHVFEPQLRKVNKYTFASGRSVVATDNHLWWKGANGSEGTEYSKIGFKYHEQKFVRRLLTPTSLSCSRSSAYLAGLYDGEGSFQPNVGHPSGIITLCQTQHNPCVVESMRNALSDCGFEVTEQISETNHSDKHDFKILGGWKARHKFLTEISPARKERIEESLFGQNVTEKDFLVSVEDAGEELTYCFETETHNYIADGCCSHNCDYYGITLKSEETLAKEDGLLDCIKGSVDDGRFDSWVTVRIYLRAAWWPTATAKKEGKIEAEMKKEDWELWFPERLTYEFLHRESRKPNSQFAIKYLNNPRKENKVKFPRELLMRRTIPAMQMPPQGFVVTTVDTAYSVQNWADYTVILTALIYGGRFYIINMVRGRFNEYELPAVIAATGFKWKPKRIVIEDSVGVKWMGRELRREMDKLQISIPVEYDSLGLGSKAKSKQLKAKPVLRLLGDDRLYFLLSCDGLEEIYNELEKFTGTSDDTHDDIVSAISLLVDKFSAYADMGAKINYAESQYTADRQSKDRHDQIYCLGKYSRLNNSVDDNPVTQFQVNQQSEISTDTDPFGDLFG
jgi:phage terminase large subunit-like protein